MHAAHAGNEAGAACDGAGAASSSADDDDEAGRCCIISADGLHTQKLPKQHGRLTGMHPRRPSCASASALPGTKTASPSSSPQIYPRPLAAHEKKKHSPLDWNPMQVVRAGMPAKWHSLQLARRCLGVSSAHSASPGAGCWLRVVGGRPAPAAMARPGGWGQWRPMSIESAGQPASERTDTHPADEASARPRRRRGLLAGSASAHPGRMPCREGELPARGCPVVAAAMSLWVGYEASPSWREYELCA